MRKQSSFLTIVAAAGFGLMSIGSPLLMATDPMPANSPAAPAAEVAAPLTLPAGFTQKNVDAQSGVKSGLVKLTERAVTKGGFNGFLAELSSQDKSRAREFKGADQSKLDDVIGQIQSAWKAKYGHDFSIDDKNLIFNDTYSIVQGQVSDPEVAINNWPVATQSGQAVTAGDRSNANTQKKEVNDSKLTKGTDVAIIRLPGDEACPEIDVSMLHQMLFWRVDVPNDRSGEQIYTDLLSRLNWIQDHQDKWPSDVNDAYRLVARNVAAAVYGIPTNAMKG
jgi:hypothetical protein